MDRPAQHTEIAFYYLAGSWYILGSVHVGMPLQSLQKDCTTAQKALPDYLQFVYAEEVKPDTPLQVQGMLSGDHNAIQYNVTKLTLGQIASRIWVEVQKPGKGKDHLMVAPRKAGRMNSKITPVWKFPSPPPPSLSTPATGNLLVYVSYCPVPSRTL